MRNFQENFEESSSLTELVHIIDVEDQEVDAKAEPAEATINPNCKNYRKLFLKLRVKFLGIQSYPMISNLASSLRLPHHFNELDAGIALISETERFRHWVYG